MIDDFDMQYLATILPFFHSLSYTELQQNSFHHSFSKGQIVYHSSSECLGLIVVLHGTLRSYLLSKEGKEITLYRLWPGDACILSASCLLNNINFQLSMDVVEDAEVLLIPSDFLSQLMDSNQEVLSFTSELTNDRFSDVMWTIEQILFMRLDQRIAVFLLDEASKCHSEFIQVTHSELASYIGSAREAVSRVLKMMQDDELLLLSRGGIEITNRKKLYELTQID